MHLCKSKKLGIPNTAANSFALLAEHSLIDKQLAVELAKMVGFRNVAVHSYREMSIDILLLVASEKRHQINAFATFLIKQASEGGS